MQDPTDAVDELCGVAFFLRRDVQRITSHVLNARKMFLADGDQTSRRTHILRQTDGCGQLPAGFGASGPIE